MSQIQKIKKGIILAGGKGTRFEPFTQYTSKHLLPINDKPMIFYPLANFIKNGIREILIISDKKHISSYYKLLGKGEKIGVNFKYKIQKKPAGLPEALIIGEKFANHQPFALNLGDHILFGSEVDKILSESFSQRDNTIFTINHSKTRDYGVLEKSKNSLKYQIVEKPKKTNSKKIVVGIYVYNSEAIKIAKKLKPSKRNEIEITDLNNLLIQNNKIHIKHLNNKRNFWFDAGDANKVFKISKFINSYEKKKKQQVANLNEIALLKKLISKEEFFQNIKNKRGSYFDYLKKKYENN